MLSLRQVSGRMRDASYDDDLDFNNMGVAQVESLIRPQVIGMLCCFKIMEQLGESPVLIPMTWEDNWPVLRIDRIPTQMALPT